MAFTATNLTGEPRSFSIGPKKVQILTCTAVSADTTGTLTADGLSSIDTIIVGGGLRLTAAPTFSGNVATIAFTDPSTAGWFGTIMVIGK